MNDEQRATADEHVKTNWDTLIKNINMCIDEAKKTEALTHLTTEVLDKFIPVDN